MNNRHLRLKSSKAVATAYIVSPIAALISLWLFMILNDVHAGQFAPIRELFVLPWLLMIGGVIAAVIEIFIVTPLLLGFDRYKWTWLNGWTACGVGFLASALVWFGISGSQILGANQTRTTWSEALIQSAVCGVVGLVGALVFRLVAVHSVEPSET